MTVLGFDGLTSLTLYCLTVHVVSIWKPLSFAHAGLQFQLFSYVLVSCKQETMAETMTLLRTAQRL